jgi:pimeloyl-ACP methyl ester carboxylesterase
MDLFRGFDAVEQLARIACPTLVCVGELDSVTPVDASREILAGLPDGIGRLELIAGAGHFPWLDASDAYWRVIGDFLAGLTTAR